MDVEYWLVSQRKYTQADSIKMDSIEIGCGGMDRIDLNNDRDQWRALTNTVMNIRIP
jgi:hypothetical protein